MSSLPLQTPFSLQITSSSATDSPESEPPSPTAPLDASKDARQIVRLAQCPKCSYPLREPFNLPCGNSICKKCVPETHLRANISYPAAANRLQGFTCPVSSCRKEHAAGDCSLDVVLSKIMVLVKEQIDAYRNTPEASEVVIQVEEKDKWAIAGVSTLREREPMTRVLTGGRLASTFAMAEMGELQRDSEVSYTVLSDGADHSELLDNVVLEHLKESTRSELDCQVCSALFLDPYTTPCGHTFCRQCIHRVLDHSNLCPVCRRALAIPPGITARQGPSNATISNLLQSLCPEAVTARAEVAKQEESVGLGDMDTPLFICTLSFPSMPTFLHIFEPRYRLMVRRAMESSSQSFGMLLHNPRMTPQGELGAVPFYEYGTMLHIVNMHLLPDGRSLIETRGTSRFRVLRHDSLDGYMVGMVERIDDVSIAAEEALEAGETATSTRHFSVQDHFGAPPHHTSTQDRRPPLSAADINGLPTQALMDIGTSFVKLMRDQSAPWLNRRVFQIYGDCPEDPALFPWWFASVLPIADGQKYKLLATSSVRERLKICAGWIAQLEAQSRHQGSHCTVL